LLRIKRAHFPGQPSRHGFGGLCRENCRELVDTRLVEFRDPLGAAAKQFVPKLQTAYLVETVQCIADIRGASFAEVADRTAMAAAWLFGLGDIGQPAAQAPEGVR